MTGIRQTTGAAALAVAAALLCRGTAAAEKHAAAGHEAPAGEGHAAPGAKGKMDARLHGGTEKTFDLAKADQLKELQDLIAAGRVEKLAAEEEIDIFPAAWDLGIWTVVVFVVLLLVLRKLAWGPMLEGLKGREANIRGAIDDAAKAREEARQLRLDFETKMREADDKVRQIHEDARKKAEDAAAALLAQTRAELKAERDRLFQEVDAARDQALAELWGRTADLATQVSAKALRRSITADDHRRLVEEALADIRTASGDRQRDFASPLL